MNWENEKVIVTGGGGLVGSHLVDALIAQGAHVTVVDNFSRGHHSNLEQAKATGRLNIK